MEGKANPRLLSEQLANAAIISCDKGFRRKEDARADQLFYRVDELKVPII